MLKIWRKLQRWHQTRELKQGRIPFSIWKAVAATPLISRFNHTEQHRLRELASRLLAQKEFYGAGMTLTPFQQAYIAATACIPVLALPDDLAWYDNWHTLVVQPTPFRQQMSRPLSGPLAEQRAVTLAGLTGLQLPVIVDWQHARPHNLGHHANEVVIHELAHKIDLQVDDAANGQPPLHPDMNPKDWYDAFKPAFDDLNRCTRRPHCHPRLNPYAATDPGEFFAVVSEYFFAAPKTLHKAYPAVYEQLCRFYRQNPLKRF